MQHPIVYQAKNTSATGPVAKRVVEHTATRKMSTVLYTPAVDPAASKHGIVSSSAFSSGAPEKALLYYCHSSAIERTVQGRQLRSASILFRMCGHHFSVPYLTTDHVAAVT